MAVRRCGTPCLPNGSIALTPAELMCDLSLPPLHNHSEPTQPSNALPSKNLALFDFDGTITDRDTWTPFMRYAVRRSRKVAGTVLLAPIALGYRAGLVSATTGRCVFARFGFIGEDAAAVRERGRTYARTVLPGFVRPSALARIEWHRAQGDDVVVVSASLDVYIGPWCEQHNLLYICTTLEERNGRLTGKYVEGDCCGTEKVRRVRQQLDLRQYAIVYAYGDSGEDRELLALAHRKYYRWKEISGWDDVTAYNHPDR